MPNYVIICDDSGATLGLKDHYEYQLLCKYWQKQYTAADFTSIVQLSLNHKPLEDKF